MMKKMRFAFAAMALLGSVAAQANLDGPAPLAWRWSPTSNGIPFGAPVVTEYGAFAGVGTRIYGIDRESGNSLWRYPASEPLASKIITNIVLAGQDLICGLDDGTILAIDSTTGQLAWRSTQESKITTAPAAVGDVVVFGNQLNQLVALNIKDGSPYWKDNFHVPGVISQNLVGTPEGLLFSIGQNLTLFDISTQKPRWEKTFATYGSGFTVVGDRVYVNSGSYLASLYLGNGHLAWQANTGEMLAGAPAGNDQYAVTVSNTGKLYAYDISGHKMYIKGVDIGAPTPYAPVISNHTAAIATQSGTIAMVDVLTGSIVWNTGITSTS